MYLAGPHGPQREFRVGQSWSCETSWPFGPQDTKLMRLLARTGPTSDVSAYDQSYPPSRDQRNGRIVLDPCSWSRVACCIIGYGENGSPCILAKET